MRISLVFPLYCLSIMADAVSGEDCFQTNVPCFGMAKQFTVEQDKTLPAVLVLHHLMLWSFFPFLVPREVMRLCFVLDPCKFLLVSCSVFESYGL